MIPRNVSQYEADKVEAIQSLENEMEKTWPVESEVKVMLSSTQKNPSSARVVRHCGRQSAVIVQLSRTQAIKRVCFVDIVEDREWA